MGTLFKNIFRQSLDYFFFKNRPRSVNNFRTEHLGGYFEEFSPFFTPHTFSTQDQDSIGVDKPDFWMKEGMVPCSYKMRSQTEKYDGLPFKI